MDDIVIPKDFNEYEPKLIANFTVRQSICLLIGVLLSWLVWNLFGFLGQNVLIPLIILIAAPIGAIGWLRPYGVKFEVFMANSFVSMFLSPKVRKYKTVNTYESLEKIVNNQRSVINKKKNQNSKKRKTKRRKR